MGLMSWVQDALRMTVDNRDHVKRLDGDAAKQREGVTERYANKGELARGGMGSIRIAFDSELMRYSAMKVFDPVDGIKDDARHEVFVEEAQITGQLDHPGICPIHDIGKDEDGTHFFTMKLVKGRTLLDLLRGEDYDPARPEDIRRALNVMLRVCDALAFAHNKGVIHRDLKPENIMVGDFGEVYLMDWGVAKVMGMERTLPDVERVRLKRDIDATSEEPGAIVGTLMYMSPEQARGEVDQVDEVSDVFGLGAILYEILTQVPPIFGRDVGETVLFAQSGKFRPPQEMCGEDTPLPAALCAICEKAMSASKADRYQTVMELKKALEEFLMGGLMFPSRVFQTGEVIVKQGDEGDRAFIIQRGYCRVFKVINGEQVAIADLKPGDVFGETSVFAHTPRTATVQAITDVTAQVVTRDVFSEELGMASSMGAFVTALASRFVSTDEELRSLQGKLGSGIAPDTPPPEEKPATQLEPALPDRKRPNPLVLIDAVAKLQAIAGDTEELGDLLLEAISKGATQLRDEKNEAKPDG
jgi:serine/threonine-protein kinase